MLQSEDNGFRRSPKTSMALARKLARMILEEGLLVQHRLPPEREMLTRFGVARNTLREAMRLLEAQELIYIKPGPNGGPVVRRPSADSLAEYMANVYRAYQSTLEDVIFARQLLEPMVARIAATRRDEEDVSALRSSVERMQRMSDDEEAHLHENRTFHELVAKSSKNAPLFVSVCSLKTVNDGHTLGIAYLKKQLVEITSAHRNIVVAIEAGDAASAERQMYAHMAEYHEYVRKRYPHLLGERVSLPR